MKKPRRITSITAAGLFTIFTGASCSTLPKGAPLRTIHLSNSTENADAFKSINDLAERVSKLEKGMSEDVAIDTLGVSRTILNTLADDVKMKYVDGLQVPQPHTTADQEAMRLRADSYKVYELAYTKTTKRGGMSVLLTSETQTTGFDLKIYLTFKEGKFEKVSIPGKPEVNLRDKTTIVEFLTDAVKQGIGVGIKTAPKVFGL